MKTSLKLKSAGLVLISSLATLSVAQAADAVTFITGQSSNEWLAHVYIGSKVQNLGGETVGDVNDLVFDKTGRITTVVLGVGGFLGMGEKNVGVPYSALSYKSAADGGRVIVIAAGKDELNLAPTFKSVEKTSYDVARDKAVELGTKASEKAVELGKSATEKAGELKDKALGKPDEMKK
jgi:PRC-barrel domain